MLIIDLLDCGIEFEARLTNQAILFTMFACEIFLFDPLNPLHLTLPQDRFDN